MRENQFCRKELSDILSDRHFRFWTSSGRNPQYSLESAASCIWARTLLDRLESAGLDVDAVCRVFRSVSDNVSIDRDRVRFELSRIPVWFRCVSDTKKDTNGISNVEVNYLVLADGREFEAGSVLCPRDVFAHKPLRRDYKLGESVLSFYPVDLARELGFEITRTWTESDSIVDWIADFGNTEAFRSEPSLEVLETETDVIYKLRYESETDAGVPFVMDIPEDAELSSKDRLYRFIAANSLAVTNDIVSFAYSFISERHTFRLLNKLEAENKIEQVEHGVYRAV